MQVPQEGVASGCFNLHYANECLLMRALFSFTASASHLALCIMYQMDERTDADGRSEKGVTY